MIGRIWLKLFAMLLVLMIPLFAAQYYMQKQSMELVFDLAQKGSVDGLLEAHMANLKKLSHLEPENNESYHREFERAVAARDMIRDMNLVRSGMVHDLLTQTLRNTILILAFALLVTYFIARGIVALLRRLIRENQTHSLRLERLSSLESWQRIARMMVHEMRAPVTPIKLVATDIETKYQTLDQRGFDQYLARGAELIRNQIEAIERLTESLTQFAKLPEVRKKPTEIEAFLRQFRETYAEYGDGEIAWEEPTIHKSRIDGDAALLNLLFFNLLKNAHEANRGNKIQVQLSARRDQDRTWITFANSGTTIPSALVERMFKPHVSTKSEASNFGLGLTIAKKIALDHNGDLYLVKNRDQTVAFELELPNL